MNDLVTMTRDGDVGILTAGPDPLLRPHFSDNRPAPSITITGQTIPLVEHSREGVCPTPSASPARSCSAC
jgi:hypothetical protein